MDKEIRYYIWDNDLYKIWGTEYDDLTELLQEWALCKSEEEWGEWYNDYEGNYLGDDYKFEDYVKSLSNEDIIHELHACNYEVRQIIDTEITTANNYSLKQIDKLNKLIK